jgi:5-methylcytosine-specific restriction endonuclease McrA
MNGLYDLLPGRPDFDESKYRLGSLCRRKHDWMKTGQSLRHASNNHCPQCDKERYQANLEENQRSARERMQSLRMAKIQFMSPRELQEYRKSKSEHVQQYYRAKGRKSRAKGMESFIIPPHLVGTCITADDLRPFIAAGFDLNQLDPAMVTESRDAWRQMRQAIEGLASSPSVARLVMDEQKRYWRETPEAKKRHDGQWDKHRYAWRYKCDPLFRRHECQRNSEKKARNRGNHTVKLCRGDIDARFAEFDNQCAFCGSADELIVEHFIPRSKGGPHAIGNLLPACHSCNTSKFNHDPEKWYRSRPFFTEARWRKILRVLGKSKDSVNQLPLL